MPFDGIDPTPGHVNQIARIACKLDDKCASKGLLLLSPDQVNALWCEDIGRTRAVLDDIGASIDVEEARSELAAMLPPNVRRHIYEEP